MSLNICLTKPQHKQVLVDVERIILTFVFVPGISVKLFLLYVIGKTEKSIGGSNVCICSVIEMGGAGRYGRSVITL